MASKITQQRPAVAVVPEKTDATHYRVCYYKSIKDTTRWYSYHETNGRARAVFRQLRARGYFGSVQYWVAKEQMWIG